MKPSWFRSIWHSQLERTALWIKSSWSQSPKQDPIDWFEYHIFYDSDQATYLVLLSIYLFVFVSVSCSSMNFEFTARGKDDEFRIIFLWYFLFRTISLNHFKDLNQLLAGRNYRFKYFLGKLNQFISLI